jgi:hypothetical protein
MKSEVIGMSVPVIENELKELLSETPETLATDLKLCDDNRSFGTVDMWNLRKRQRTTVQMRRWLN